MMPISQTKLEADYAKRGRQLLKRALNKSTEAQTPLDAFLLLCSDPSWQLRASTTRIYKAAIIQVLKDEVEERRLDVQEALEGIAEITRLLGERRARPSPRTSAKKSIDITEEEIRRITQDLRLSAGEDIIDATLRSLIEVICRIGLRPSEVARARLVGRMLLVRNGKHSHGRAPGPVRRISLERTPELIVKVLEALLFRIKILVREYGSWERVHKILAERLARTCRRAGLVRISPYALRHVAIATWKRCGFQPAEIAALAGHISVKTAWRHYAGARGGWRASYACLAPDKRTIARVISHSKSPCHGGLPPPWCPPSHWAAPASPGPAL